MNKKNNILKIAIILYIVVLIISFLRINVIAFDTNDWNPGDMTGGDDFKKIGNTIIGGLQIVGSLTSIIVIIILGIKYMMGSVEEKAIYKKTLMPYVIGAIFVFGISNILAIVQEVAKAF